MNMNKERKDEFHQTVLQRLTPLGWIYFLIALAVIAWGIASLGGEPVYDVRSVEVGGGR